MPNGPEALRWCRAVGARRVRITRDFMRHSLVSQRLEESEEAVIRLETCTLAAVVRLELRQGCLFECKVGVQIALRGLYHRAMTEESTPACSSSIPALCRRTCGVTRMDAQRLRRASCRLLEPFLQGDTGVPGQVGRFASSHSLIEGTQPSEVGQLGATVCDPTQEIADQPEAPTSTLVREADFNETRRRALHELSVVPIPQTPVKPASAQILLSKHRPLLRC